MILFLRCLFFVVLLTMLWVTSWASFQCPLFAVPRLVSGHPWFIATLFDAYWGFVTFFLWVAYKEGHIVSRISWFMAIMLLGNIAMSLFCLRELFRHPRASKFSDLLVLRRAKVDGLGVFLFLLGGVILIVALNSRHAVA